MYIEYKPGEKYATREGATANSLETFQDAGYILAENDLVVDIDNVPIETVKQMLKTFNIVTETVYTTRGVHLYFIKPKGFKGAKSAVPLGIEVEFKHIKNTNSITVKQNGIARKVDNPGLRQELPEFLQWNRKFTSLLGMDDGDGRNNALYEHRMRMGNIKDWKKIIHFINDYVFAEQLSEKEMEVLTRDIQIDTDAEDAENQIANLIIQEYNVVYYLDKLYRREDGEYVSDIDGFRRLIYQYAPGKKTRFVDEVIKQLEYRSKIIAPDTKFDIKFNNGILRDGKFIEVDYTDFTPYNIDITYNPDVKPSKEVDQYINQLTENDEDYKNLLLEIMAHTLIVDKEFKRLLAKFFIFVGRGGEGKGTMLQVIRTILGGKNCTGLSIQDMSDERYFTTMQGKLANLGDDIQDEPINNKQMKLLKNISTCDFVSTRDLFKQSREVELTTTLIFTSNHILKSFEKGDAYKRRVTWLPMMNKPKKKDNRFISNITTREALEYWLKLMVDGYTRLYENQSFTNSVVIQKFNQDYHEENNTTLMFIRDREIEDFLGKRSPEIYEEYETWCLENGLNVQSAKLMKNSIKELMPIDLRSKRINGKTAQVFRVIDEKGNIVEESKIEEYLKGISNNIDSGNKIKV